MPSTPLPASAEMVTAVIRHAVDVRHQALYDAWLRRIIPVAARFPGHRGVDVIRPPSGFDQYTIAIRFERLELAEAWFASSERRALMAEAEPLLKKAESVDTLTGLEFWFEPPTVAGKRPAAYKQFLMTLSVIYPLTLVVPSVVGSASGGLALLGHPLMQNLLVAIVIVGLMTYVVMPRYSRLLAGWLAR